MVSSRRWHRGALASAVLAIVLAGLPARGQGLADEIRIHGLVSQGYMRSTANNYLADTDNGSFEFSEAIVNFSTRAGDNLRVGLQVLARDLGSEGNSVVGLDWAYGDYRLRKNLGVRFGKLKSHIGLYNKGRDVDMLRTVILLPQSVYEETTRDFAHSYNGFSLYGNPLVPVAGRFNFEVYLGTLPVRDPNSSFWQNNLRIVSKRMPFLGDLDLSTTITAMAVKYVAGGMLMWHTPVSGLRLGGNLIKGEIEGVVRIDGLTPSVEALVGLEDGTTDMKVSIDRLLTLSAEYSWRDLLLAAELLKSRFDVRVSVFGAEMEWQGYYLMANYRLSDLVEVGSYYAQFYPNQDDKKGTRVAAQGGQDFEAWRENIALSARFDVGENWLLKLEAHRMDGVAQVIAHENPQGLERNWYLFLAKVSAHF